ncbi:MAG: hypothetical protein Q4F54_04705 [Coriobacteriia bacterium]|nr:hypothetical protein [Coriobacteriia bacterium]
MNVVGDYTDNVLGYKILPFCSSILLVGPDNKVTTMISALITYSPYFVPET